MRHCSRQHRVLHGLATLSLIAAATACARSTSQATTSAGTVTSGTETGAFIVRLGADTVAVERFTRTAHRPKGDIVQRAPNTRIAHYVVSLAPTGLPTRAELSVRRPDGSPVPNFPRSASLTFGADTVMSVITVDTAVTRRLATSNAFPALANSFAMTELALRYLVASGRDSANVATLGFGVPSPNMFPVKLIGRDSARINWFLGSSQWVRIDRSGRIPGVDASATTVKVKVDRLPTADIPALGMAFAGAEQAGRPFLTVHREVSAAACRSC